MFVFIFLFFLTNRACNLLGKASQAGSDAKWRSEKLSHDEFICRQIRRGIPISPLFAVPGVTTDVFRRDWLHIVDLGVGADFLGNCFKEFCKLLPGRNKKLRRKALWDKILQFYDENKIKDRMVGIKSWGIQAPRHPPKLKANAACVRALIPFCHQQCMSLLSDSPKHNAIKMAAHHLHECYKCLSTSSEDWTTVLPQSSKEFAIQCHALATVHERPDWVVKPKMHQFLEMCTGISKPNMSWTYRDEDYGGSIAQLCRIKGGCWRKILHYSQKMLVLFKTRNRAPRIRP